MSYPDIHGDQIVFTCEGDLWLGSLSTGQANRLTRDDLVESHARFSPDGKSIAYTAQYEGFNEAYVLNIGEGAPRRISFRYTISEVLDWTPDGKRVMFRSNSVPRSYGLYIVDKEGGLPDKMPLEFAQHGSFGPDGNQFVWTRFNRADDAWFRYTGGMQNQIWRGKIATSTYEKLTEVAGTNEFPFWTSGQIGFVNERDGMFTLMSIPETGGRPKALAPPSPFEISWPSADGDRVIYKKGYGLEILNIKTGVATPVNMKMANDDIHTLPFKVDAEAATTFATPTITGKRILAESRGQIVSAPMRRRRGPTLEVRPWSPAPAPPHVTKGRPRGLLQRRNRRDAGVGRER